MSLVDTPMQHKSMKNPVHREMTYLVSGKGCKGPLSKLITLICSRLPALRRIFFSKGRPPEFFIVNCCNSQRKTSNNLTAFPERRIFCSLSQDFFCKKFLWSPKLIFWGFLTLGITLNSAKHSFKSVFYACLKT